MSKFLKWNTILFVLLLGHALGIWLFYLSYFSNSNSTYKYNPKENPYHDKMRFKNEQQRQQYKQQWFPTQSEQVILNVADGFVLEWARNKQEQNALKAKKEEYPNSYYRDVKFPEPINRLLTEPNNTIFLEGRVDGPAITGSRMKSFIKGNLPLHIDLINNYRGIQLVDDNIIYQEKVNNPNGKKVLHYGYYFLDQVVGKYFDRKEIPNYSNYHQDERLDAMLVDRVEEELKVDDWSTLVLHYESLDAAVHTLKSQGEVVYPTVELHNQFLQRIINNTQKNENLNQTILYFNDHGSDPETPNMHGGFSDLELTLILFGYDKRGFIQKNERDIGQIMDREYLLNKHVNQIDITATYCMLRGIPLPAINIGVIIPDFFINRDDIDNSVIVNNYFVNINSIFDYLTILKEDFLKPVYSYNKIQEDFEDIKAKYNELFDYQDANGSIPDQQVKEYVNLCISFGKSVKTVFHREIVGPNIMQSSMVTICFFIISIVFYICCLRLNSEVNNDIFLSSIQQNNMEKDSDPNRKYIKLGLILILLFLYVFENKIPQLYYIIMNITVYLVFLIQVMNVQFRNIDIKQIFIPCKLENKNRCQIIDSMLIFSCVIFNSVTRLSHQYYERVSDLSQLFFLSFYITWIFMTIFSKKVNIIKKFITIGLLLIIPFATYICGYYSNFKMKKFNQFFIVDEYIEYFRSKDFKFYKPLLLTFLVYTFLIYFAIKAIKGGVQFYKKLVFCILFYFQFIFIAYEYMYKAEQATKDYESIQVKSFNLPTASYINFIIIELYKMLVLSKNKTTSPSFTWKYTTFLINFSMTSHYVLHCQSIYLIPIFLIIIFTIGHVCIQLKIMSWGSKFAFLYLLSQWFFYASDHIERDESIQTDVFKIGMTYNSIIYPIINGLRNTFFGQIMTVFFIPLFVIAEYYQRNQLNGFGIEINFLSFIEIVFGIQKGDEDQVKMNTIEQETQIICLNYNQQKNKLKSEKEKYINLNLRAYMYYLLPLIVSYSAACLRNIFNHADSYVNQYNMPSFFYQSTFFLTILILLNIQYFLIRFHNVLPQSQKSDQDWLNNEELQLQITKL